MGWHAVEEFLPDYTNHGDYLRACEDKSRSGTVTKILFPEEDVLRATELRLKQQFFLVSASLQDILRRYKTRNSDLAGLPEHVIIQLSGAIADSPCPSCFGCWWMLNTFRGRRRGT